jgi:SecD/SecF fusion protein
VGGVLGEQDLNDTMKAGAIAVGVIFLLFALVYRVPGLIAIVALTTYLWSLLVVFDVLGVTLSLAAIVAYVLGIGLAAGANILTFERVRDELRAGLGVVDALASGAKRSLRSILDSNATVFICAAILLLIGIGPIRGFAVTTILGILLSLLTNVALARLLLHLLYDGHTDHAPLFGGSMTVSRWSPDYLRWGRWVLAASVLFVIAGAVAIATRPLNYDIEFKAGSALDIKLDRAISQEDATDLMYSAGVAPATVAIGGRDQNLIAARFDDVLQPADVGSIIGRFKDSYGPQVAYAENTADPAVRHGPGAAGPRRSTRPRLPATEFRSRAPPPLPTSTTRSCSHGCSWARLRS